MRFSSTDFFHESVSPWPLSIPLGQFGNFTIIRGHNFGFIGGVVDTGDKTVQPIFSKVQSGHYFI